MTQAPPLSPTVKRKLSWMMFLQYAIWGAWLPLLWPYLSGHLGFEPGRIGWIFAVGAVGAILAPFVAGQIADRWFATERFLGISHILGGVLVWQLPGIQSFEGFLVFSLLYSVVYSPTLPLTNSLSFHHIPDRDRDFGRIRVWGTVGWIFAGIAIGQWLAYMHTPAEGSVAVIAAAQKAGMADAFRLSAILGILLGGYCFFLPHTPPKKGKEKLAFKEASQEVIHSRTLLILFLLAVPVSCIHQFYFVHTAGFLGSFQLEISTWINKVFGVGGGGLMTVGQMSEILVLASIPFLARRFSRKTLLGIGLLAYAARMALFANVETLPMPVILTLLLGVAMHGLCFGCFIFVSFMIVDEECTKDVRASAQSLYNLVIIGVGIIVGSKLADFVASLAMSRGGGMDYHKLFSVPMWGALACLVVLLLFYPRKKGAVS
jgi:nucleoside transporter